MKLFVAAGVGLCALAVAPAGQAQTTTVSLTATPASLSFTYQAGAAALPAAQTIQVKRAGAGTALDFTVTPGAAAPWLIVSPSAGKTGTSLSVRVNPTSLLAGTYSVDLRLDATGGTDPLFVPVTLVIRNPPPAMSASPGGLTFDYTTDQSTPVASQTVSVSTDGEPLSFTAAVSGGTWFSITPALGIAVSGSPVTLTVSVATAGLLPGVYSGKITLNSSNASNKSLVIAVSMSVTPGKAIISSIWPNAAPVGSLDQTVTIRGSHLFKGSVVHAGTATLTTTWIATDVLLAVIPKTALATQGTLNVTVTNAPQPASDPATFTVTPPGPQIQSVVNAASFAGGATPPRIAPGEIISIFGSGLGPAALIQSAPSGGAFPVTVGTPAATVEFELVAGQWTAVPIIFAEANQINAVAPFAMVPASGMRLRVTYNTLQSVPFTFDGVAASPGLFTTDSSGRGQVAALNYDAATRVYSLNSGSNPAPKGSTLVLFATGAGVTNPLPSPEGQVIPLTGGVPTVAGSVAVTIGGDGASVLSATAVPGSIAGLVQLNVSVPTTVKSGKDLPVVLTVGGQASSALATVAVK